MSVQSLSCAYLFSSVVIPYLWRDGDAIFYRIDGAEAADLSYGSVSPRVAREISSGRGGDRCLTYGEVIPESIERDVFDSCLEPALRRAVAAAAADTVTASGAGTTVYDLGSGTGKIPLQIALLARARGLVGVTSIGVELVRERHVAAAAALARALRVTAADLAPLLEAAAASAPPHQTVKLGRMPSAEEAAAELRFAAAATRAVHGNILEHAWWLDADAIFINNTVFEPVLMAPLVQKLASAPLLRRVVVLRSLCPRHREGGGCERRLSPCCAFSHPPSIETTCEPTWDAITSLFAYDTLREAAIVPRPNSAPSTPKRLRVSSTSSTVSPSGRCNPASVTTMARLSPRVVAASSELVNPITPVRATAHGLQSPPRLVRRRVGGARSSRAAEIDGHDDDGLTLPPDVRGSSRASIAVNLNEALFSRPEVQNETAEVSQQPLDAAIAFDASLRTPVRLTSTRKPLPPGGTPKTSLLMSPVSFLGSPLR